MRSLAAVVLLIVLGCGVARSSGSTLVESFGSRPLAVAGCVTGGVRVFLTLELSAGAPGSSGKHAVLVLQGPGNEAVAWQTFRFAQGGVEVSETSGGLALDDVLSSWRKFLLSRPLRFFRGVEWIRSLPDQQCPAQEDSPWQ